ncbi:hypothetical protein HKBW3S42_01051, partial [Candidatus Hakubella thermalkaliphila]
VVMWISLFAIFFVVGVKGLAPDER